MKGSIVSPLEDRQLWTQQLILMDIKSAKGRGRTLERYTYKSFQKLQHRGEKMQKNIDLGNF